MSTPSSQGYLSRLADTLAATETGARLADLVTEGCSFRVGGLRPSARGLFLALLARQAPLPALWVTHGTQDAERLCEEAGAWLGGSPYRVLLFPEREKWRFDEGATDPDRMAVLQAMAWGEPVVAVAPVGALLEKTLSPSVVEQQALEIQVGTEMDMERILASLVEKDYEAVSMVEHRGQFSRRGGILDIYPATGDAVRLEFFGDQVEIIRVFEIDTQRSIASVPSVLILPLRENERASYLASFLPPGAPVILDEPARLRLRLQEMSADAGGGTLPAEAWDEVVEVLGNRPHVELMAWGSDEHDVDLMLDTRPAPSFGSRLEEFSRQATQDAAAGTLVVVVSPHDGRIREILGWEEEPRLAGPADLVRDPPGSPPRLRPGLIYVEHGLLGEGFHMPGPGHPPLTLLTDRELLGVSRRRRYARPAERGCSLQVEDLREGDPVVHITHGVARYEGLVTLDLQGSSRDFLKLHYAGQDSLFVPVEQMDLVTKYIGADAGSPPLARLGRGDWQRTRTRISQEVREMADRLLSLYARRKAIDGHACAADTPWQTELEAAFPYDETPDQERAIAQVKQDMESAIPMDRLICGDVGYGKTEIAIRAAFKAVTEGRQVAVLVPTTVLAQQHHETFRERMGPFPVRVEVLSRFRSAKEQRAVVEGMEDGSVDLVIGTHRLLGKDVRFRRLGLVIVDEEQHFGVEHKEALKERFPDVDVLTLSATPIPRTMQMSLVGVRDLSLIETPPAARLPVRTYLFENVDEVVAGAITRELEREGQIFFVHNRVRGIEKVANDIRALVPRARVVVGHGQMSEDRLENVMAEFLEGEHDVLVCTTIIESGLDLPNVNTIIVNNAHMFGLGQLYQLRGRVGRSSRQAWCYLLYPPTRSLTPEAELRLETIRDFTALGSGYQIALRDLEIRGAGNLLGAQQSGQIAAVGFHLYVQMLEEAVAEAREGRPARPREQVPVLELPAEAFLPEAYVPDSQQKITLYRRLAEMTTPEQVEAMQEEMRDRYGPLPPPVENLLQFVRLKLLALDLGVPSVKYRDALYGEKAVVCLLPFVPELKPRQLDRIAEISGLRASFANHQLVLAGIHSDEDWVGATLAALRWLREHTPQAPPEQTTRRS